jgi:hypothetical protein
LEVECWEVEGGGTDSGHPTFDNGQLTTAAVRSCSILPLLLPLLLHADDSTRWHLGARVLGGFLAPHHASLWVMVDRHAWAAELHAERAFSGSRPWHTHYAGPRWGIGAMVLDAGSDVLGPAFRVLPYLVLPIVPGAPWQLESCLGWGLGVVRDPFHRSENAKQHAIGSTLNLAVRMGLSLRRSFGRHAIDLGLSVDHLSNGAMQRPNLGINVVGLNAGYTGALGRAPLPPGAVPRAARDSTWRSDRTIAFVVLNGGWNEVFPVGSGRRFVASLSASGYHRVSAKSAVGAGLDLFHKASLRIAAPELADSPSVELLQAGVHLGWNLLLGNMALQFETGTYLRTPVPERAVVYTRVGMRQRITPKLFANLSLKSHFFVADHFEIGLGYRFR